VYLGTVQYSKWISVAGSLFVLLQHGEGNWFMGRRGPGRREGQAGNKCKYKKNLPRRQQYDQDVMNLAATELLVAHGINWQPGHAIVGAKRKCQEHGLVGKHSTLRGRMRQLYNSGTVDLTLYTPAKSQSQPVVVSRSPTEPADERKRRFWDLTAPPSCREDFDP